ncbi:S-adenosyl-L-methionine-dependent methyltransferase [Panus rudis PR-1116 ss-1]|nr:S-adenosyl-L-methionine-dependent methyltransferase [Panus rudis PR-1116 ss-1]
MTSFAELDKLVSLISSAVNDLKEEYVRLGHEVPGLDDVKEFILDDAPPSEKLSNAIRVIQGACAQLPVLVTPPKVTLCIRAKESANCACLGIAIDAKVADQLVGHPEGLHVSELASVKNVHPGKLSRVLRVLATKHCFREVSQDVFANNRLSAALVDVPTAANIAVSVDECLKATAFLADTLFDPVLGFSDASQHCPWSVAMKYDGNLWDYYQKVDPVRRKRFGEAMIGYSELSNFDQMLHGFPWSSLSEGTTVCDLGGGIGHVSMHIAKACPGLRIVLQDLPSTIEEAKQFWQESAPDLVQKGRVDFVPIDFLSQSPVRDCDVYFVKHIIHDWNDTDSKTILSNVTKSMKPGSRVILQEFLLQPPVRNNEQDLQFVKSAPEPLLPNYGEGSILKFYSDMAMLTLVNSQERTLREFIQLGDDSGLVLTKVWDCGLSSALEFRLRGEHV